MCGNKLANHMQFGQIHHAHKQCVNIQQNMSLKKRSRKQQPISCHIKLPGLCKYFWLPTTYRRIHRSGLYTI